MTSDRCTPVAGTSTIAAKSEPAIPPNVLRAKRNPIDCPAVLSDRIAAPIARGKAAPMHRAAGKIIPKHTAYRTTIHCSHDRAEWLSTYWTNGSMCCKSHGEAKPKRPMHTCNAAIHATGLPPLRPILDAANAPRASPSRTMLSIDVKA